MHHAQRMNEPCVLCPREDPVRHSQLFDALQPFKDRKPDDRILHIRKAVHVIKNLVCKSQPIAAHPLCLLPLCLFFCCPAHPACVKFPGELSLKCQPCKKSAIT